MEGQVKCQGDTCAFLVIIASLVSFFLFFFFLISTLSQFTVTVPKAVSLFPVIVTFFGQRLDT